MNSSVRRGADRDTRLLLATLVISAGVLVLLSRFRFPEKPVVPDVAPVVTPAPLERLAARATYGELASILAGLDRQLAAAIVPVRVDAQHADAAPLPALDLPAIRVGQERAVTLLDRARGSATVTPTADVQGLLAIDAPRGVALLKVSPSAAETWRELDAGESVTAPGYAASVEMTPNGRAVRPFYFGRVDRTEDIRWRGTVWRFSGLQQVPPHGSAIFTLDGRFVGLGVPDDGAFVVAPASMLRDAAARLASNGSVDLADLGLDVAPLTGDLQLALGADSGVVITHVVDSGPAHGALRAGDVIQRIGSQDIGSVEEYTAAIAGLASGEEAAIVARRRHAPITATIVPAARGRIVAETSRQLGLDLRSVSGVGTEVVRVTPSTAAAIAGILAGDVITLLDENDAPSPAAIRRAFERAADGAHLVVGVQRGHAHHVFVLSKP